ncbi:type IV secretory system conjugative DNA transfer family protein [Chryseobacterium sp. RG1]|uniref:Type IV secretory system conjugative DNA transfer family protein n=1 Tax=Chryseobacterium tagetis TaxID=2801334 RepID=A0ABS8A6G2_9FLAO|nr:type IV secretory system conjugative DNA transfer family protein [Chryseobacterium tagetis]MCA6068326.1 type IV secretory system conjugative DNA transfer family protein [Chryseobacterium tagetis]
MEKDPILMVKFIIVAMSLFLLYMLGVKIIGINSFLYNISQHGFSVVISPEASFLARLKFLVVGICFGYAELLYILIQFWIGKSLIPPLKTPFNFYKKLIFYPFGFINKKFTGFSLLKDSKKKFQGLTLQTKKRTVQIPNPFRGILIIGGPGAGKSESFAVPFIRELAQKQFSGICYDFKYPALANDIELFYSDSGIKHYVLNFNDSLKSHRCNPLNPKYLPHSAYAREYASAITKNLMKESIKKEDFWSRSATDLLTACIWFLKKEYPKYCDLPHTLALIATNHTDLIALLSSNSETKAMILSLATALESEANSQLAGVVGSLQGAVAQINTPEFMYIFGGEDFDLNINNPDNPIVLTVGNNPSIATTLAPLCSLVISVAAKQLNQPRKHHSFVLLDEFPTVFINDIQTLPNTGRSNKIASMFFCQDLSQLTDGYTKEKADVLFASCLNHFYGQVSSSHTADILSKQFGKKDQYFESNNTSRHFLNPFKRNVGQSRSVQERDVFRNSVFMELPVGEFIGRVAESSEAYIHEKFLPVKRKQLAYQLNSQFKNQPDFVITDYYEKVRDEVNEIISLFKGEINKKESKQDRPRQMNPAPDNSSEEFSGINIIEDEETNSSAELEENERNFKFSSRSL